MRLLIVVDMQEDFVNGVFGFPEAKEIIEPINKKIEEYHKNGDLVLFTQDSHTMESYEKTQEGKVLPPHCLVNTKGFDIIKEFDQWKDLEKIVISKKWDSFSIDPDLLYELVSDYTIGTTFESVELVGLVTNICVLSCAVTVRCSLLSPRVIVDASCCRSFDPKLHEKALDVMSGLLIDVINR